VKRARAFSNSWRSKASPGARCDGAARQAGDETDRARIFRGDTRAEGKLLSLFEPSTEIIRKGKAGKPNDSARW